MKTHLSRCGHAIPLFLLNFALGVFPGQARASELPSRYIRITTHPLVKAIRSKPRILLTVVTHNEQASNVGCAPLYESTRAGEAALKANRQNTIAFAEMLKTHGAKYQLQTDYTYFDAMQALEARYPSIAASTTGGVSLFPYLEATHETGISIDPHNHATASINIADVNDRLKSVGLPESGVVGGFLAYPAARADWAQYGTPVAPLTAPATSTFQAKVLWGGASPNHTCDPNASGVWKPKDEANFQTHDSTAHLPVIGTGRNVKVLDYLDADPSDIDNRPGVEKLLAALDTGSLDPNLIYTAALFLDQCTLTSTEIGTLDTYLTSTIDPRVAAGDIVWAGFSEILKRWSVVYAEVPNIYDPVACP